MMFLSRSFEFEVFKQRSCIMSHPQLYLLTKRELQRWHQPGQKTSQAIRWSASNAFESFRGDPFFFSGVVEHVGVVDVDSQHHLFQLFKHETPGYKLRNPTLLSQSHTSSLMHDNKWLTLNERGQQPGTPSNIYGLYMSCVVHGLLFLFFWKLGSRQLDFFQEWFHNFSQDLVWRRLVRCEG